MHHALTGSNCKNERKDSSTNNIRNIDITATDCIVKIKFGA